MKPRPLRATRRSVPPRWSVTTRKSDRARRRRSSVVSSPLSSGGRSTQSTPSAPAAAAWRANSFRPKRKNRIEITKQHNRHIGAGAELCGPDEKSRATKSAFLSARSDERWIVGPSAVGSEKGIPSSMQSAPLRFERAHDLECRREIGIARGDKRNQRRFAALFQFSKGFFNPAHGDRSTVQPFKGSSDSECRACLASTIAPLNC